MSELPNLSIFDFVLAPAPRYLMRLALIERLIRTLPNPVSRFLEIGPGMGDVSVYLASVFPDAHGVLMDFSEQCVELLGERVKSQPRLQVVNGDLYTLQDESSYDLVVACEVFEHLEDDALAFRKVAELLRPGGYFLFSVPSHQRKWQQADIYAGHYRRYERDELLDRFKGNGFDIDVLWIYGFPLMQLLYPLRQLYYWYQKNRSYSKADASKQSGIERSLAKRLPAHAMVSVMRPFLFCQDLVKNSQLGDGFLVLAHKSRKPAGPLA
jgi:SAM-dependent methyltransferase